jgi:hypothetical protein
VTGSSSENPSITAELAVIHALTSALVGAILMDENSFLIAGRSGGMPKS